MGRWAQRRIRGGGGVVPTPPTPPAGVTIIDVQGQIDDTTIAVFFSGPVTFVAFTGFDPSFDCAGAAVLQLLSAGSADCVLQLNGGTTSGDAWELLAQPPWLSTPAVIPQSGMVE